MGAWVAGHNILGYLPEADTVAYETWKDAVVGMVADAKDYADTDDEHHDDTADETWAKDDYGTMRAQVDSALADDGPTVADQSFRMCIVDNDGRPIVFWVHWEITRDADEEN